MAGPKKAGRSLPGGTENVTAVAGARHDVVFAATHSNASGSRIVAIPIAD
jgi:hypothetical protein